MSTCGRFYGYKFIFIFSILFVLSFFKQSSVYALFLDGEASYSARAQLMYKPKLSSHSFKGIQHNLSLLGRVQATDKLSFNVGLKLFDDPRQGYFGDVVSVDRCSTSNNGELSNKGEESDCEGRHQNSLYPSYKSITPAIREAYLRYASDYCIFQLGRRARSWGIGALINDGRDPFSSPGSIYDGVSCDINLAGLQNLSFAIGYDVLANLGSSYRVDQNPQTPEFNDSSDNLRQLYLTVESSNKLSEPGADFIHDIGLYFAWISGSGDSSIKLADLYTSLIIKRFSFYNEFIMRLGSSSDPNIARLGGLYSTQGHTVSNSLSAVAVTGSLNYILSQTGSILAPKEFQEGDLRSHTVSLQYAYVPGDDDGYYPAYEGGEEKRDDKVQAISLNPNYKIALILYNSVFLSDLRLDGIYDANAMMNTMLVAIGYSYKDMQIGDFGVKLVAAWLNKDMPAGASAYYNDTENKVVGYKGKSLGYELDLSFLRHENKYFSYGVDIGVLFPGNALNNFSSGKKVSALLQLNSNFRI